MLLLASALASCERETPSELQFLDVAGGRLAYQLGGDPEGEAVLLSHGAIMADSFLRLMSERALADYRLIRIHRRGYGQSSDYDGLMSPQEHARDLMALLSYLDVNEAHLVGHSSGSIPLLYLASSSPDLVRSLLLLDGSLPIAAGSDVDREAMLAEPGAIVQENTASVAADYFMEGLVPDWRRQLATDFPRVIEQVESDIAMSMLQDSPGLSFPDVDPAYGAITQPAAYVLSEDGPMRPFVQVAQDALPQLEILELTDMGHEMMIVHPRPVARLIADWLQTH